MVAAPRERRVHRATVADEPLVPRLIAVGEAETAVEAELEAEVVLG